MYYKHIVKKMKGVFIMNSKKFLAILCLLIGVVVLAAGCAKEETKEVAKEGTKEVTEVTKDSKAEYTKEDIKIALEKDKSIADITWSEDNTYVFFTKEVGDFERKLYMWRVGENTSKQIEGVSGNLYEISKSTDGRYITVNEGTSTIYSTIIISVDGLKVMDQVVNTGGPIWSPDSDKIAFSVLNNKKPSVDIEWDGTCDLMIYDINTKEKTVVIKAENDFYYTPKSWDEKGLKYEKFYFDGRETEELTYTGKTDDKAMNKYDISSETYTDKTKNMEFEIKYPVISNMENKEIEQSLNKIIKEKFCVNAKSTEEDEEFKATLNTDYEITKQTDELISIKIFSSIFMEGAAHPSNTLEGLTLNMTTGKEIELKDLFKQDADFNKVLNGILKEKVTKLDFELFEEYKGLETQQEFYLTDESLIIFYVEGVYTPHAVGPLELKVEYKEIEKILK